MKRLPWAISFSIAMALVPLRVCFAESKPPENGALKDPAWNDLAFRSACELIRVKDYDEALKRFKSVASRFPESGLVYNQMGLVFEKSDKLEDAIRSYRQAVSLKPEYGEAWLNLARVLTEAKGKKKEEAIAAYEQAGRLAPEDALPWYGKGVCYYELGRTDEAIAAFRAAIKLKPYYAEAWSNLGWCLGNRGDTEQAVEAFREAVQINPGYTKAWSNLAVVLHHAGRHREAEEAELILRQLGRR